jgi:hypothetical protein
MTSKNKNTEKKENYFRQSWNVYKNVLEEHLEETIDQFSDNELVEMLELLYKLSLKATFRNCHFKMKTYLMKKRNFNEMTRAEKVRIIMPCLKKMTLVNDFIQNAIMYVFVSKAIHPFPKETFNMYKHDTQLVNNTANRLVNTFLSGLLWYYIYISNEHDAKIYNKIVNIFMKVYKRNNSEKNIEELVDVVESLKIELKKKNEVQKTKKAKKGKTKQNKQ